MSVDRFVAVEWDVAIVCTDRGQHKRIRLATVEWLQRESGAITRIMPQRLTGKWEAPDDGADVESGTSRGSYGFWCPICKRKPFIQRERWWEAMEATRRVAVGEIDLSRLNF